VGTVGREPQPATRPAAEGRSRESDARLPDRDAAPTVYDCAQRMSTPASPLRSAIPSAHAVSGRSAGPSAGERQRPAASAASRAFGTATALGALSVGSALFVTTRLFESWRVTSQSPSHEISLFGQRLAYPAANAGAIVVTALAALGLLVMIALARGIARELLADRRFRRSVVARPSGSREGAWMIEDTRPQAFCAGLLRPHVYLSTGTLERLDASALAAVLAHERHHASCYDPLRLACGRVLVDALFFIPALRRLVDRQQTLAEISADEAAVYTAGVERSALASAMLSFSEQSGSDVLGVEPERVDYLLGERTRWQFPLVLCLGIAGVVAVVVALAVLAAGVAAGSATLAPPFLSSQPCVVVLAVLPASTALAAAAYSRRRRAARQAVPSSA
jgi:hypothetical protein